MFYRPISEHLLSHLFKLNILDPFTMKIFTGNVFVFFYFLSQIKPKSKTLTE